MGRFFILQILSHGRHVAPDEGPVWGITGRVGRDWRTSTQEGDLGRKMREALPNAFLFGLTGTPINRADKNTFYAFGAETDASGYMSRYGLNDSIRDGATKELHFEPRLVDLHI